MTPILEVLNPLVLDSVKSVAAGMENSGAVEEASIACTKSLIRHLKKVDVVQKVEALNFLLLEYEKSSETSVHLFLSRMVYSVSEYVTLDSKSLSKFLHTVNNVLQICAAPGKDHSQVRIYAQKTFLAFLEDRALFKTEDNSNFSIKSKTKMDFVIL